MSKGPFSTTPYNENIYRARSYNTSPFSATPFNKTPYVKLPLTDNFTNTPYTINPYNQKQLMTVAQRATYLRNNMLNLPDPLARYYLVQNRQYREYMANKDKATETTDSSFSDYNNSKQINSLRDAILGAKNKNMEHALNTGITNIDVIADVVVHSWKHYLKPLFKGEALKVLNNLLVGLSEDLDVLANPVKAMVISAWHGENVGQALIKATVGDEEGIKNYDYDTGNLITDILLESLSDPITLAELLFTGGTATVGKAALKNIDEPLEAGVKKLAKNTIVKNTIIKADDLADAAKYAKNNISISKFTRADIKNVKGEVFNKLLRVNSWDEVATQYNKQFTKIFAKRLRDLGYEVTTQTLTNSKAYSILLNTVDDMVGGAYKQMTATILPTLKSAVNNIDDIFTKTVFKAELGLPGVYSLYRSATKSDGVIRQFLDNNIINKVSKVDINRNITNADTFVKAGNYKGVNQVIDKELSIKAMFEDLAKTTGPQEAAAYIAPKLESYMLQAKDALKDLKQVSVRVQERRILNILQSIDSYEEIDSIEKFIKYLENLDESYKVLDGEKLASSGFEKYIDEFRALQKHLDDAKEIDKARKTISRLQDQIVTSAAVQKMEQLKYFEKYSVQDILKQVTNNELNLLKNSIDINKLERIITQYKRMDAGMLLEKDITDLMNLINKTLKDPLTHLDYISPVMDNALIQKVVKYSKRVLELAESRTPSIINDLENIKKLVQSISIKTNDELLPDEIYQQLFYREIPGVQKPVFNNDLVKTLKKSKKFVPDEEHLFSDTTLAHWVKDTNERYNNLADLIDAEEKVLKSWSEEISEKVYSKNAMKRLEDLKEIHSKVLENTLELQYEMGDVKNTIRSIIKDNDIFRQDNFHAIEKFFAKIYEEADTAKVVFSERQIEALENLRSLFQTYKRQINKILEDSTGDVFKARYYNLRQTHNAIMSNYNKVKKVFDKINPLDNTADFRKFSYRMVDFPYKTYAEARGHFRLIVNQTPISWEEFRGAYNIQQRGADYSKYLKSFKENQEQARKGLAYLDKLIGENENTLNQAISAEDLQRIFGKIEEPADLQKVVDEISRMDFALIERKQMVLESDTDYFYVKMEGAAAQAKLNADPFLKQLRQDKKFNALISNIINRDHKQVRAQMLSMGLLPEDLQVITHFAVINQGIQNWDAFYKDLDEMMFRLKKFDLPDTFKSAVVSTMDNFKNKYQEYLTSTSLAKQIAHKVQGYVNGSDLFLKKQNVDTLLRKHNITDEMVFKALTESGITDTVHRHNALFDTAAQIMVWEAEHKRAFDGIMLDIETTGLIDINGLANGKVTEIAMLRKVGNRFEKVYDGKIQVSAQEVKDLYNVLPTLLSSFKQTQAEYIKYLTMTDKYVDEGMLLSEFVELLKMLPSKTKIRTFNGDEFDKIFLKQKVKAPKEFDRIVSRLTWEDMYQELVQDRFVIAPEVMLQLQTLIERHLNRQRSLVPFEKYTGVKTKLFTGVDNSFLNTLVGYMKIESDAATDVTTDWLIKREELADHLSDFFGENDLELHLEVMDTIRNKGLDAQTLFKEALSPYIKEIMYNVYSSVADTMNEIGTINTAWRDILIPSYLFDVTHPRYAANLPQLMKLQNLIADTLEDQSSEIVKQLRTTPMTNLTQLMNIGLEDNLSIAYRRINTQNLRSLDLEALDASGIKVDNNIAKELEDYARAIAHVNNNTKNIAVLQEYRDEIYQVLQELKDSNIILEATATPIRKDNVQYSYAVLETLYHKVLNRASMGQDTKYAARKLISKIEKEHPELANIIQGRIPSITASVNASSIKFQFPSYMDLQKHIELAELKSIENIQKTVLRKLDAFEKTAQYPLNALKSVRTAGTVWEDTYNMLMKTYNKGIPTKQTLHYNRASQRMQEVLFGWQTNVELDKLSADEWVSYLLYSNRDHTHIIYQPSNKYFNNSDAFANFIARKKELEAVGIKMKYDQEGRYLKLTFDDSVKITIDKNITSGQRYAINGTTIDRVTLPEISLEDLMKYTKDSEEWVKQLYTMRQELVRLNPELSGLPGITNYADQYYNIRQNAIQYKFNLKPKIDGDKYMPYFNLDAAGDYENVVESLGSTTGNYFYTLSALSNKMLNHSHKHLDFAEFIMQGGIKLDSDVIQKMSTSELREMLSKNQELALVYLRDNKKAVGGIELMKVNSYSDQILAKAKELGATIVPWEYYAEAAKAINNYTYGSQALAIWHKVMQAYKQSWLLNIGVIFRNAIDSTMKNFAEGTSVTGTMKAYAETFDILRKYDNTLREIKKMDPIGKFRLANAEEYFNKPNAILDKETYHFIYDFMERSGINSVITNTDGIFGVAMKPMSDIERVSRLAMYMNLKNQGENYSEIMRRIAQTHFNYDTKSYAEFIAGHYIPFATYTGNNILYVMHLVEENPSFLKHYFNAYTPIWDFDSLNFEEVEENTSLQYQIINGNIPLSKLFGYKDKKITRTVNTKYGPKEQEVVNTAVLKMGSSFLDGLGFFVNPIHNIKEKLAPPLQVMVDSVVEYGNVALGNTEVAKWMDYQSTEESYQRNFGSASIQSLFRDPDNLTKLVKELAPGVAGLIPNDTIRTLAAAGMGLYNKYDQSTTAERTDNDLLGMFPSVFGATSRWGKFTESSTFIKPRKPQGSSSGYARRYYPKRYYARKVYPKKSYAPKLFAAKPGVNQGVVYRYTGDNYLKAFYTGYPTRTYTSGKRPYSKYDTFLYNIQHPNQSHRSIARNKSGNMQTIPQYLYSYGGRNKRGGSKILSWMRMDTSMKVKNTLKRLSTP